MFMVIHIDSQLQRSCKGSLKPRMYNYVSYTIYYILRSNEFPLPFEITTVTL